MVTVEQVKALREKTGASMNECKKALEEAGGDLAKAGEILSRRLGNMAGKRVGREAKAGVVESYVHSNGKLGVLVELFSETDFVSRNTEFRELAHDLALHIAASAPQYLSSDAVPDEAKATQRKGFEEEASKMGKPKNITDQIVEGKIAAYFDQFVLLNQPFVKDPNKKISDVVNEAIGKFGENIKIGRFVRLEI
ncbi:MAG: elongation factor Ts [Candidatus Sungbacteria bacterium RIFCSPLOWO2_01_FULL_47_32]|uniref:Elongation factor Ts n=1 Tax=Candidatus Sungbacteria bacterium RIFCSPHIGHO2_01_FULL_47_32 TaxID=1802264 RepID=A0A1G2K306_9BACT|nr:MAG: Tsf [Parcubacteria group bacterium GW2011_GWA2_47_10]OGZ93797.1 MAG: elongation factor Ts [Candidatus Sungbacteria bacterium RIFCSPHIGHO2_01_FULL_47_32]OGZ99651.1 MAG: elongation factor Ts [Candidatus Sungbacteria bacterium RIFCSPHIGHO2_02_FULL_46_12]OHA05695.1 MAG: elongation factor Ts [Candidatus Sungbacteria bacterium RIFCSPLOWO2_01_FULL_47_32]